MPNRFEVISQPNKFRLKPGVWVEPETTTTEGLGTTTTDDGIIQYVIYYDGITEWRKGVRGGCFVWDKALTGLGFDGIEDTDWENVRTLCPGESTTTDDGIIQYVTYYDGVTEWRKGVRDGCFVWDRAITLTGFDGVEDTDWENVRMLCGSETTTTTEEEIYQVNFGLLYNWYAATDSRIANTGWHVAYYNDWRELIFYLDPAASEYSEPSDPDWQEVESNIAGGPLKETGFVFWDNPNTGATNEVGFNARGSSWRGSDWGDFYALGQSAMYFCGDVVDGLSYCIIHYNMTYVSARREDNRYDFNYRRNGFSIRLCRPATDPELLLDDGTACDPYVGNDLKSYRTVKIGTQVWTADNLAETKYRNGDPIPEVTDNGAWAALASGALCAYNNDWNNV